MQLHPPDVIYPWTAPPSHHGGVLRLVGVNHVATGDVAIFAQLSMRIHSSPEDLNFMRVWLKFVLGWRRLKTN